MSLSLGGYDMVQRVKWSTFGPMGTICRDTFLAIQSELYLNTLYWKQLEGDFQQSGVRIG